MACLEELLADVEAIRTLMENKKDCCDDAVTYFPTEEPTTDIEPGVGDPPEFYGETAVTDWDDWAEHVCYNAHKYVDYLVDSSGQLFDAVKLSSIFLGLIAAALALLAFSGIGLPIAYGLAATVVAGIALSATATTFLNTPDDFEDARFAIVCAILNGYSLADAVESALGSGTDWDLFYQFVDYDSAIAIIYEGGYGTDYLPAATRDDCDCVSEARFMFDWASDIDGWEGFNLSIVWDAGEFIITTPTATAQWKGDKFWQWSDLETRFGLSLPVSYDQVKFKFMNSKDIGNEVRFLFQFYIWDGDNVAAISPIWDTDDFVVDTWNEIIWDLDETFYSGTNGNDAFSLREYRYQSGSVQRLLLDDLGVYKKPY